MKSRSEIGELGRDGGNTSVTSYKKLICPVFTKEEEADDLLKCLGLYAKSIKNGAGDSNDKSIEVQWMFTDKFKITEDKLVGLITKILMRITLIPIFPDSTVHESYGSGYTFPFHTAFSYLRIIIYLQHHFPSSGLHLIDLALDDDSLSLRPFINHRSSQLRILSSAFSYLLSDSFTNNDNLIPLYVSLFPPFIIPFFSLLHSPLYLSSSLLPPSPCTLLSFFLFPFYYNHLTCANY